MTIKEKTSAHNTSVDADAGQPISTGTNQEMPYRTILEDVPYGAHLLDTKCTFRGR
jgi:hypothetical protein